jgi:hypothetical protein
MKRAAVACSVVFVSAVACGAFEDLPDQQICHDIPEGGCPAPLETDAGPTANCADPACSALYACVGDGGWSLIAKCPLREGGAVDAHSAEDARREGGQLRDVAFEVPPGASGGPGCTDLESPDCPLSLGLACPSDQCCCCQDLYVCLDGGWDIWGYCDDGGSIVPASSP